MKYLASILICLILFMGSSSIAVEFDSNSIGYIELDSSLEITFPESRSIVLGSQLTLPAKIYYLRLSSGQSMTDIKGSSGSLLFLRKIDPADIYRDIVTGARQSSMNSQSPIKLDEIGTKPVFANREIKEGHDRYAEIFIYPVTCDLKGNLWFHEQIYIEIENERINTKDLITEEEFKTICSDSFKVREL